MKKIFTILFTLISFLSFSQSTTIVISQVYGAGGNAGSLYNADYVELHNKSNVDQTISGFTIQYASVSQTGNWSGKSKLPTVTIPAGGYYLVQMSSASSTNGVALPTPDYLSLPTISMSAKNARVALVSDTATLNGCPSTSNIIDLVGYGTATVCSETAPTDTLSILRAAFRNNNGCDDTNNNLADFSIATPNPRNSASPVFLCGAVVTTPTLTATSLTTFGNICVSASAGPNIFTISGSDLTAGNITVGPLAGFGFSTASGGPFTSSLTLSQSGGTLTSTMVYVQFSPTAAQTYDGNITVSGGGATSINVAAIGSGVSATSVTSGSAASITTSGATISGTLVQGCSVATAYGVEYSTSSTFTPGTGTVIASTNLSGTSFSASISGLTASTTYYYVVYVTTSNGTTYGTIQSFTTQAQSTGGSGIVISQVYGAGGNAGAPYNADYVELHNKSNLSATLSGYSIQYASVSQTGNWTGKSILPTATIPAGGYYLVQMSASGVTNGVALPTPDYASVPTISMSAKNGRVALVSDTTTLNGCPATGNIIDLVGYGTATVCSETAPTDTLSILRAAFRNNNGCDDTNNNLADFTIASPNPRNSASPIYLCGSVATTPTLSSSSLIAFGNVCINSTVGPNTFTISGTDLTAGDITVGPLAGFAFSSVAGGPYTSSLTIAQTGGTLTATTVYVQFNPTASQSYNGNITVSGGGATAINVAASGTGTSSIVPAFTQVAPICAGATFTLSTTSTNGITGSWSPANNNQNTTTYTFTPDAGQCATSTTMTVTVSSATTITTGSAASISTTAATISGTLVQGCSVATAYGVEYSTSSTFTPGTGTLVASTNLSGTSFSASISGLTPSTTYYYVVYVTTSNGTTYGTIQSFTTQAQSTGGSGIVISQVYGAGGNSGAPLNADYVELHNKSNASETLTGFSIQYASVSATGNWSGKSLLPTITIPAGGYYLIQMSGASSTNGVALPTPDYAATPTISMSGKNGRVALVSDTATLSGCPATSNIIDLVGYGTATVCSETAPTDTLSILRAAFRNNKGCDDTNNNLADFTISSPNPRNSASPIYLCGTIITTPTLTATTLTAFGNICINSTVGPNTFTISGSDLTAGDITVGPLAGFAFSSALGGPYTSTLTIAQTGGTLTSTAVYVQFNPTSAQSYNGNISVSGAGAIAINVAASGSGVSATTVTTGLATAISTSGATINGTLIQGCAAATGYGIEYSISTFTPGSGTMVASTNLSGSSFSVALSGLTPSTTYYYVVYVTTASGTVYGTLQTFTTQTPSTGGSGVVISQVYGGGGGSTGTFNADYVELHNNSGTPQDISGYKIIYGSATGTLGSVTTNNFTFPSNVVIPAGGYLLVASAAGTGLANLPVAPDYTFTLNMSGTNGKVAFGTGSMQSNTAYASQPAGSVLDFVGYGSASEFETAATGALSSTTADFRNDNGCQDTDDNLANFTISAPLPRNSSSPINLCGPIVGVPRLVATSLDAFADVCPNVTEGPNSFTISGTDLTTADITVGPLDGYGFSLTSGGTYTSTITISQAGGTLSATTVYVQFTPTLAQSYNGNIPVVGAGASIVNVAAIGSGAITPPTVLTADSIAINSNTTILRGKITGVGCDGDFSSILTYGIEYSGLQNFPVGSGIKVRSILHYASDSTFYSTINNLVQNAAYYYRAYITNADTIIYGQQKLYITPAVQAGLTVYGTPLHPGNSVHFSVSNVRTDHYGVRMFDMTGRLVCEKNFYLNADGFIDNGGISTRDQFILPGHIAAGVYSFQVSSPDFKIQKLVVVE